MSRLRRAASAFVLVMACCASMSTAEDGVPLAADPLELFEQRIMPIFRSAQPSSCVQCHLAAVDLKNYILPSHEKTFVSLRDQGLINLDDPAQSKILTLIRMGEKDLDTGARLIHEQTRQAELDAFASWVKACCNDPRLCGLPALDAADHARPEKPVEVIRHLRKSRVVDSFVRNVWSQRMRCFPCHTPHEIDKANPRQQAAVKKQKEFEQQYGELVDRLKIFKQTPEETLQYLVEKSQQTPPDQLPLLNLANPRESLLVVKPMSKLPKKGPDGKFVQPSSAPPVSHMGGLKMHLNDHSYKSIVTWIQDYANVVGNRYTAVDDLPADNWNPSKMFIRIKGAPETWPLGAPVQMFVHAWDDEQQTWNEEPVAFTQGTVTPRRMVNGSLFVLAEGEARHPPRSGESNKLPRGRYLVKTYVDMNRRLAADPSLLLGEQEFQGQAEIKRARWREGFRPAQLIDGKSLRRD